MLPAMLRLGAALGDGNELAEGLGVAHRQIGKHLSIDVDAGQLEAMHELVVRQPLAAGCGVDPSDPQLAHVALARPTVAIRVLERVQQSFVGRTEERPVRHPEALSQVQDFLVAPPGWNAALDARHFSPSPSYRERPVAGLERPFRLERAACYTAACGAGSYDPAHDSSVRPAVRSFRSSSPGTV